jgi:hypothetical protein
MKNYWTKFQKSFSQGTDEGSQEVILPVTAPQHITGAY